jgi:ABC-type antimicrobial peptide transport system permease subunit
MSFLSLAISLVIVEIVLPEFNSITGKQLSLNISGNALLSFLGITLLTGIIAGSYPALYLSGFNPVSILKGKFGSNSNGELWLRKGLVIFQFTLSAILIAAVLVVYMQMGFIQSKNLGYNKDNLIYFNAEGDVPGHMDTFLSEIRNISGVVNASSISENITSIISSTFDVNWQGKKPGTSANFFSVYANYNLIETLGMKMEEGRTFSKKFTSDSLGIIFNQAAINLMVLKNPIGKVIHLWGKNRHIIGVVKNFNFESLHEQVKPLFIILNPQRTMVITARIKAGIEKETIERLKNFYKSFNPGFTFDYKFTDQDYQALYSSEEKVSILSRYFAGMAIIISCLGLFGLSAFTAEKRRKEIGIRKVLGASEAGIIYLLSGDFSKLVLVSNLIALPVAYYVMNLWLQSFAYKINLNWWLFIVSGGIVLLIALLTVGLQAIKAATANPVKSLRYE